MVSQRPKAWRKYLLIPRLTMYAIAAPRTQARAWERFWSRVDRTGADGDVLWDADQPAEADFVADRLREHADVGLPLVDLGCGNGRQARALTGVARRVVGVDASAAAVRHARSESARSESARSESARSESARSDGEVEFRVDDAARPGLGDELAAELGEANVHLRGVLHVLDPAQRVAVVRNVAAIVGRRGTVFLSETDVVGDRLEYLLFQGATPTRLPEVLRRCVASGIRAPSHFGPAEVADHFPAAYWRVLAAGPTTMFGVPLQPGGPVQRIPGYFAVLRAAH